MKHSRNKQYRNEAGKDLSGFNLFETCFDGAIESNAINADFQGSDNYSELRESGAKRIDVTVLPVFNNSNTTTQI